MKLSVSAFRAQASAQRKILSSYKNQLNYGACTSLPALGGYALEEKVQMMVDSTAIAPASPAKPHDRPQSQHHSQPPEEESDTTKMDKPTSDAAPNTPKREHTTLLDKSPGRTRSKSNQRWMKLRTTVQLSGAITSTNQKPKAPLKREDSFLKRFSTRQIPETQETVDTGDETETHSGSQNQNEVNRRRRKRRKEMSKTVVNPDENFYFYWLMTVTVCVLYNLWTLIVRQSFPELQKAASAFWYSGDGFTDIVFVCDIMVQFRTGYLEQGLMVYNSRKLASHYLKSRAFILDTLSLLPLDFLQFKVGVNPLLRFPRFLKVYRVYNYYYMVESRTVYPNLWRVVNLIHILLILAHWFGCFYYLLSEAEGFQGDWVYPYRPGDYATLTRKYLGSLYWSTLTLTTIGDLPTPETNAESRGRSKAMTSSGQSEGIPRRGHKSRLLQFNSNCGYLFTIISYLIGVFIFATIVGQVGNVITNRNANRLEFERLLDGAKTYMRHHKVPGGMKRRVLRWYDYSWSRGRIQGGGDINTALGLLPDKLKTELALHVNLSVLKKVTIFQECQPEFLHDLVLKMKAYIFTPGDLICRKGEVAREMFIIADGILDVISETGRVLTTMKAGDFFGEIGILNLDGLNKRTADVRSVGYSELFSLSREDVLAAMKDYPEAQEILQSLGRKRLMEAKNASKMHKAQARQAKEHDSSGDSDTAGKRIVEKLRSDVKGLKKALRRSRRGTSKASGEASSGKKHSILRRMSHVQSSDECEGGGVEGEQSPIGAGLPLLQRLKILKEKQEKEAEEAEHSKSASPDTSPQKRTDSIAPETAATTLPFRQKLKLLKQKDVKETMSSGLGLAPSTVRTQVTGIQVDRCTAKTTTFRSPRDGGAGEEGKLPPKERPSVAQAGPAREKSLRDIHGEGGDATLVANSPSQTHFKTSINVPAATEADNTVPKLVRSIPEVPPVSKDCWKLLKKSSISCSDSGRKPSDQPERQAPKRATYLSKSDTVLERQKTEQKDEEKRSRSISPSNGSQCQKRTADDPAGERRRSRSVGHSPKSDQPQHSEPPDPCHQPSDDNARKKMKKYNSISDLSPEYSGLPFVKKLKILNERQKLEELEKELLVRSVSLDVSEKPKVKRGNALVRSQSEAGSGEYRRGEGREVGGEVEGDYTPGSEWGRSTGRLEPERDRLGGSTRGSEGSIASPESNETLERRHLKSILKKLSAEDSASDEDKALKIQRGRPPSKRDDSTELKKLMREPTLEGYAARHKKLTKSVTFDSDTLPSPLDTLMETPPDEPKPRGYSPNSPTAILTLQLSNLSMMPLASPKKCSQPEEENGQDDRKESADARTTAAATLHEEGGFLPKLHNKHQQHLFSPPSAQQSFDDNFPVLPFSKSPQQQQQQQLFSEIEGEILEIIKKLLEKASARFESQFRSLQGEVEKRDEIIVHLQSKIRHLERKRLTKLENGGAEVSMNTESSATDSDISDAPFQREDSCETVWDVRWPFGVCGGSSPEETEDSWKKTGNGVGTSSPARDSTPEDALSDLAFDYSGNVVLETRNSWEGVRWEGSGEEEVELRELAEPFLRRERDRDEEAVGKSSEVERRSGESGSKGGFLNRMSKLQRTISGCREKNTGFVALDIDDSSKSSDVENGDNKDWEVQMLVEELAKKDPYWKTEEGEWESQGEGDGREHLEGVEKLREEVNTLKRVVCDSDLSRLTNSELDILESIIEAKDQKILQIAKSSSLDNESKSEAVKRGKLVGPPEAPNKHKDGEQLKKSSLKHKIGQALSFDFHDMESRTPKVLKSIKHGRSYLRAQKTLSGSHKEHHSLYNLWRTSARLRNRVLDDSERIIQKPEVCSPSSRSSLPILVSGSPSREKSSCLNTSLPVLSRSLTSSVSSFEDGHRERVIFHEAEAPAGGENVPSTSGANSLNNFIKSVGQKVKQAMVGDMSAVRDQVPTISKLLEDQSSLKGAETGVADNLEGLGEEVRPLPGESPEVLSSFDRDPKTDPPDL